MANCPKCNAKLKLSDWRQHCPHCGANIFVYDLQERLMKDADIAEVQYYHFQKKIDRVKAAFVGSKPAVVRIFTSLLPAGPLFLPIVKASFREPLKPFEDSISLMTIFNNTDNLDFNALMSLQGTSNKLFLASLILLVLSIVITLAHFILLTLACSPKGKIRNIIIDTMIILSSFGSAACFLMMGNDGAVTGTLGIGAWLYLLLQAINVIVDIYILIKGIEINHKQCYVGGIPIEEYFELVDSGKTTEEIREIQYATLLAQQKEKEEKLAADLKEKEERLHHSLNEQAEESAEEPEDNNSGEEAGSNDE